MRLSSALLALPALTLAQNAGVESEGVLATGPHKSHFYEDASLPKHTIFAPITSPAGLKLPVLIWGNGGCSSNGTLFRRSLFEVASYGFFAIAMGSPAGGGGMTSALTGDKKGELQKSALDWVTKNAGQGKYANVDKSRIAVAGQSCGGLET